MLRGKENKPQHEVSVAPWQSNSKPPTILDNYLSQTHHCKPKSRRNHHSLKKQLKIATNTIPTSRQNMSDLKILKQKMVTIDQDCARWDSSKPGTASSPNPLHNKRVNSQFLRPTLRPKQLNADTIPSREPFFHSRTKLNDQDGWRVSSSPMHRTHGRFTATSQGRRRPKSKQQPDPSLNICINQLETQRMKRILSWLQHLH